MNMHGEDDEARYDEGNDCEGYEEEKDEDEDIDKPEEKEGDAAEEWKRINVLLDVAWLSGWGWKPVLASQEEDDESTKLTIIIKV